MLSATATILGGPAPRQAEKLKDRAGQIDLVKQARQLHPAPEISGNSWGDKHWMGLYTAIRIMLNAGHEKIWEGVQKLENLLHVPNRSW